MSPAPSQSSIKHAQQPVSGPTLIDHARQAARFTVPEAEVVALILDGLRNKEIAQRLGISEGTVKHHVGIVFLKAGCRSRVQLATALAESELISIKASGNNSSCNP